MYTVPGYDIVVHAWVPQLPAAWVRFARRAFTYHRHATVRGAGPVGEWRQVAGPPAASGLPSGVALVLCVDSREVRTQKDRTYTQVGVAIEIKILLSRIIQ